ncbi:MAG: molybdopterin cofactor-binding domain-containing protein [Acidiferrobacterales bacterium]
MRVHRVACAIDCGIAVNPDIIEAQMESTAVFRLNAALRGEFTVADGSVQRDNLNDYPIMRIDELPEIKVHIMPSAAAPPGGVGEPGVPPVAGTANAIFAATGQRIRLLPVTPTGPGLIQDLVFALSHK